MKSSIPSSLFLIIAFLLFFACEEGVDVNFRNSQVIYEGRIDTSESNVAKLYWSGTSITLHFEADSLFAVLEDAKGDNYYNVILDYDSMYMLQLETEKKEYLLFRDLSPGKHTIQLFKRTEWDRGASTFYGFRLYGDAKVLKKTEDKKRKIEFYGNSITAGYAVEDFSGGDDPSGSFTNNYESYAAITARHFNAQYHCICKSGIGITISWFPSIMPDIYNRINPEDAASLWNFRRYTPDVVVINLFQNDSWLLNMPDRAEYTSNFGTSAPTDEFLVQAYRNFVSKIRAQYPRAKIICMLGNMDASSEGSKWPGLVQKAANQLDDSNVFTHFVPFKNTPGHPTLREQQDMASSLIAFINKNIEW